MTVACRLEGANPTDLDGLREALGLADRPDYVIEHLGDLLLREDRRRAAAQTPDKRDI
jgi:hypothetical protein